MSIRLGKMAFKMMPTMAANANPEKWTEPMATESLAPYFTPMAMTKMRAAIKILRICMKSMCASTMLRIPTAEIIP